MWKRELFNNNNKNSEWIYQGKYAGSQRIIQKKWGFNTTHNSFFLIHMNEQFDMIIIIFIGWWFLNKRNELIFNKW